MHRVLAAGLWLLLAACSTLGGRDTAPSSQRGLDALNDDLASAVIVFDLPRGVGLVEGATRLSFDVASPVLDKHLSAVLAPADADEVAGVLPPPGSGRAYYFVGLSDADGAAFGAAQAAARGASVSAGAARLSVAPRFCVSGPVDPTLVTVSVYAALPERGRLAPLLDRQLLTHALGNQPPEPCS